MAGVINYISFGMAPDGMRDLGREEMQAHSWLIFCIFLASQFLRLFYAFLLLQ